MALILAVFFGIAFAVTLVLLVGCHLSLIQEKEQKVAILSELRRLALERRQPPRGSNDPF